MFRLPHRPTHPAVAVLAQLRASVARVARDVTRLLALRGEISAVHRHVHELKEELVTTKQELLTAVGEVKTVLVEAQKDVNRLADRFDEAIAAGDLDDAAAAVAELRAIGQSIGDRAEQTVPEQPATGGTDEPVPGGTESQPVDVTDPTANPNEPAQG